MSSMENGHRKTPFIIGVAGGTASGKLKMSMKKHLRHVLLWIYDKNNQIKGDDAVEEVREVYGHDSIGRMTVFRWLKKFRNGDKNVDDLEDDPRSGRPSKFNEKFCARIVEQLGALRKRVTTISQDSFYRDLTSNEEVEKAQRGEFNFDHPDAFDHDLMLSVLNNLQHGKSDKLPVYDFRTHSRVKDEFKTVDGADVILVEGILIFYDPELRNMFNMKIFVDADPDIRLARRVARDTKERGRPLTHVLHQYLNLVKPAFEEFCLPTKKYADIIIPRGADNDVAIGLIVQHIQELLRSPRSSPETVEERFVNEKENRLSLPSSGASTPRQRIPSGDVQFMSRPH